MTAKTNLTSAEKQRKFIAAKKAAGLKRLVLWVQPEDVEAVRLVARQPHVLARYRVKAEQDLRSKFERDLGPKIKREVSARLERKTTRAMLVQRRAQARRTLAASDHPPELIRFLTRPPAISRNRLKSTGWLYDPVAAVWHLPDDPAQWPGAVRLLIELENTGSSAWRCRPDRSGALWEPLGRAAPVVAYCKKQRGSGTIEA